MNITEYVKETLDSDEFAVELQGKMKSSLLTELSNAMDWQMKDSIHRTAKAWMDENANDLVRGALSEAMPVMEVELKKAVAEIAAGIGKALVEKVNENLAKSWTRTALVKELFS